jgi:dCMP deaminase
MGQQYHIGCKFNKALCAGCSIFTHCMNLWVGEGHDKPWRRTEPKPTRPSWHSYFSTISTDVACRSTCLRRQVGAVIVRDKQILSTGYNGTPMGEEHCVVCERERLGIKPGTQYELCKSVHAESNAIIQAAKHGVSIDGADIYVTDEPCFMCRRMIVNAGIKSVYVKGKLWNHILKKEV